MTSQNLYTIFALSLQVKVSKLPNPAMYGKSAKIYMTILQFYLKN